MRGAWRVLEVELRRFVADPKGAVLTIIMPLVLGGLLGMLFAPRALSGKVQMLVVDEDGGPEVAALLAALEGSDALDVTRMSRAEGEAAVARGRWPLMVVLPEGTSASLKPGGLLARPRPKAALIFDPARGPERARAEGAIRRLLARHTMSTLLSPEALAQFLTALRDRLPPLPGEYTARVRAFLGEGAALARGLSALEGVLPEGGGLPPPIELSAAPATGGNQGQGYQSYAHTFAGMLCQFLMFMAAGLARGLIADRKRGVLARVQVAPMPRWHALLGAGLGATVIALMGSAVVYGVAVPVFGVRVDGSWAGLLLVLLAQGVFIGGFTLLLAGLGRTERQVETMGTFIILTVSFIGGAWIPSFLMPEWAQLLGHGVPTWWATEGLAAMTWRGLPFEAALAPAGALVGFGALLGAVGIWRFRW